jgi:hypothetical protein
LCSGFGLLVLGFCQITCKGLGQFRRQPAVMMMMMI